MKFFACVIYSLLLTSVLLLHGPAVDQQHRYRYTEEDENGEASQTYCDSIYYPDDDDDEESQFYESYFGATSEDSPFSKSYCLDRNLHWPSTSVFGTINKGNEYYDHCCYVRYQARGKVLHGCKGLKELDYLDIKETAYKIEQQYNVKVFDVSCNSSYTYLSAFVIISLLGLLL